MNIWKNAALTVGAIALCSVLPQKLAAEEYPNLDLKFALYIADNTPQGEIFQWWADEIGTRSGGKIKVQTFFSESLGKSTELLELVSAGAVNFAAPSPGYYASKLPLINIGQLPVVMATNDDVHAVMNTITPATPVMEEHARNNVIPLFWTSLPNYHVLCNSKIETVADFANKKMRSYGAYVPKMWEAVDAVGVTVLLPEIYEGMQRGSVDCSYLPDDFSLTYKLHEVADYYISINFGTIMGWPVYVNADQWDSWPAEVRDLIAEVSADAGERDRVEIARIGEEATKTMLDSGMELVEFQETDRLMELLPDFIDVWVARMDEEGRGDAAREIAEIARAAMAD